MRLAQWRLKLLIEHSTSHQLWLNESFELRNAPIAKPLKKETPLKSIRVGFLFCLYILLFKSFHYLFQNQRNHKTHESTNEGKNNRFQIVVRINHRTNGKHRSG